jgi:hypothetical protein
MQTVAAGEGAWWEGIAKHSQRRWCRDLMLGQRQQLDRTAALTHTTTRLGNMRTYLTRFAVRSVTFRYRG